MMLYFIHFIQRDFERSAPLIKTLEELIQKEKGLKPLAYLWFYCVLGNDQIYENFSKTQQAYKQALLYLDKIEDKEAQRSYLLQISSNYVESLSNFGRIKEAISLCDSLKGPLEKVENKSQKIVFLGVSAALRLKYGQYDQSLADIAQSVVLISEQNKDEQLVALLMFIKAHCLLYKNQPKEAFELIQKYYPYLLEVFSTPESMVLVKGQFIKGACLASFGRLDEALSLVQHTIESYERSTGFENDSLKGMGYRLLGEIFETKGDLPKAYESYRKAETLYDTLLQEKSLDDLSLLYMRLAILGAKQGDDVRVKKYLSLHIDTFGFAHPRTLEIKKYLDSKGLPLP